jgi:hypothetical protein
VVNKKNYLLLASILFMGILPAAQINDGVQVTNLTSAPVYVASYQVYEKIAEREIRPNDTRFPKSPISIASQQTTTLAIPAGKCAKTWGIGESQNCQAYKKVYLYFSSQPKKLTDIINLSANPFDGTSDLFHIAVERNVTYLIFFNSHGFDPEYATNLNKSDPKAIHAGTLNAVRKKYKPALEEYVRFAAWSSQAK